MPIRPISTLKGWFVTGAKPTQGQFWDWLDSFFHRGEAIPQSAVEGLEAVLLDIADQLQQITGAEIIGLTAPGSITIPSGVLLEKILVESAVSQQLTIETSINAADIADNDTLSAGEPAIYQVDRGGGSSAVTIHFRSFTTPLLIKLYKR